MGDVRRFDDWVLRQGRLIAPATGGLVAIVFWLGYPTVSVVIHGLGAWITWRFWRLSEASESLVPMNAATLSLAFPVIGPALAWAVLTRQQNAQGAVTDLYRNYIALRYEQPLWARPIRDQAQMAQREAAVRPMVDQLRFGDLAAKLRAAEALASLPEFSGLSILRGALAHPSEDTRLMASLTLIRVEQRLTERLEHAQRAAARAPQDPDATERLAQGLHDLIQSGTASEQVSEPLWRQIEQLLRNLHAQAGALSADGWLLAARARARLNGLPDALTVLETACECYPEEPSLWAQRCAWLYDARAFARLRDLAPRWEALVTPGSPEAEVAHFWVGHKGRGN